ncbi:uncharacterized protein LOC126904964 [Daktulosphaira vitifoliae]|uniref:uncharacterized protein LOC126904964 n=1 Tax=Daktulosphaira vitifoliae TaxID=58002 RepID=UPI0021AAC94B|nr:uncharacterized protein LOC126904964 [Daktulosphaira vitifoliae]
MISLLQIGAVCWFSVRSYATNVLPDSYSWSTFTGPVTDEVQQINSWDSSHAQSNQELDENVYNSNAPNDLIAKPFYSFSYGVSDPNTGNKQSHSQTRDGSLVKGEYTVLEPNGVLRLVSYIADAENGFQASVRYIQPSTESESDTDNNKKYNFEPPSQVYSFSNSEQQNNVDSFPERPHISPLSINMHENSIENDEENYGTPHKSIKPSLMPFESHKFQYPEFNKNEYSTHSFNKIKFPLQSEEMSPFKSIPSTDPNDYSFSEDSLNPSDYPSASLIENSEPSGSSSGLPCIANQLSIMSSTSQPVPTSILPNEIKTEHLSNSTTHDKDNTEDTNNDFVEEDENNEDYSTDTMYLNKIEEATTNDYKLIPDPPRSPHPSFFQKLSSIPVHIIYKPKFAYVTHRKTYISRNKL